MGGSGGTPTIGPSQGYFPTSPQFNWSALPIWDMTQAQGGQPPPALDMGGLFAPPAQPQQQQAPASSPNNPWYGMTGGQNGYEWLRNGGAGDYWAGRGRR